MPRTAAPTVRPVRPAGARRGRLPRSVAAAWWWALPVAVALAATAWRYDAKPLWRDEIYTLATAVREPAVMLRGLRVTDAGLGPWYALVHPWVQVSQSAAWLRLPGAVAAVVAVGLVAGCARRLRGPVGGAAAGVGAGLCAALLPVLVEHSQEARPYPVVVLCVTAAAYGLLRDRERPRGRWLLLWVGASTAAAALHVLSGAPACAALVAVVLLRPAAARRRRVLLGAVPLVLVTLAMVAVGFGQAPNRIGDDFPVLSRTLGLWHSVAGGTVALVVLAVLCGAGLLARSGRAGGRGRFAALFTAAWVAAPVAANAGSALGGQLFEPRYATAAAPGVAVLCGLGVAAVAGRGSARRALAAGLAAALLLVAQVPHLAEVRRQPYVVDDMPSAARDLAARARPGDAVVYLGNTTRPMARLHLPPGLGLDDVLLRRDTPVSVSIGGDEVPDGERAAVLAGRSRVWLVGIRLNDPWEVVFPASSAAVRTGRSLRFDAEHGQVRVQLWARPGTA